MIVFLDGEFVPEERALIPVFDRGFLYGDGLFETVLAMNTKLFRWQQHFDRLANAAAFLRIPLPATSDELLRAGTSLLGKNEVREGVLRLTISRGAGERGYAPTWKERPAAVMTIHPMPAPVQGWNLAVSSCHVAAGDRLLEHKTANRLMQVLAAIEAREAGCDESLLLDTNGHVMECASSNLFWIEGGAVVTTPLSAGILPGVTRAAIIELCREMGIPSGVRKITLEELLKVEGAFVTLTSRGVVEVSTINKNGMRNSDLVRPLARAYNELVKKETSTPPSAADL